MVDAVHHIQWSALVELLASDKKRLIKTLDTVFLQNDSLQWYFTNKSGSVSKKKKDSTTVESILDRFARFALSNPFNAESIVGVLVEINSGSRKWMKKDDLAVFLNENLTDLSKPGSFLQVYLRPLRGADVVFSCESNRIDDAQYNHEIIVVHQHRNSARDASAKHEVTDDIQSQITEISEAIISCLREIHNHLVDQITIECIVDDNQHAWLSSVSHCEIATADNDEHQAGEQIPEQVSTESLTALATRPLSRPLSGANAKDSKQFTKDNPYAASVTAAAAAGGIGGHAGSKASESKKDGTSKKKKKDLKTGESGFRRSLLDEPPSIELMAKFAAEKDRHERMLEQQEGPEYGDMYPSPGPQKKKSKGKEGKNIHRSNSGNGLAGGAGNVGKGYLPSLAHNADVASLLDPVNHLDLAEKRIEELHKLASTTATIKSFVQQQQQHAPLGQSGSFTGAGSAGAGIGLGLAASRLPLGSAASAAVAGMARPGGTAGLGGTAPSTAGLRSAMSGSEADFLVRQINSATDVSQLSMFSNAEEYDAVAAGLDAPSVTGGMGAGLAAGGESIWSNDGLPPGHNLSHGGGSMTEIMGGAMKEKIAGLERQITALNTALARKEAELEKKDAKMKKLASDVDIAKRDAASEIRSLTAEHELDILRLKEVHSKEKSALMLGGNQMPASGPAPSSPNKSQRGGSSKGSSTPAGSVGTTHEANSKLIEQVELLRQENRRLQESASDERRGLLIESSNKLLAQERMLKAEIMELRSAQASCEDRITQAGEELSSAMAKIHALQNVNQQLEVSKKAAVETQQRLRGDLKNMQQSVQASYRLETSQGIGAGGGGDDTAMRLAEAKNEAKTRQLMNKLEFLKAQLDTEKKAADEARVAAQKLQLKLDEVREEFKGRLLKAENDQRTAVEIAEQQLDLQYQERMNELTTLQMKMHALQGQLAGAHEQEILAKQREDGARSIAAKSASQQAALKTELEQLRIQVQQMREEKETEILRETGKQSQDAVIRRLDNERQYLKSQLASEVTHKSELQAAFVQCQQQLNDVQKQWKSDVDTLKDASVVAAQNFADKEQKYLQFQAQLDSELKRCQVQSRDLKEGFMKMRDQVRMEQVALENANAQHRRLQEAFEEAQADITRLRQQEQQTGELHKAQMDAINETVADQERRNTQNLQNLRDELSSQFLTNAHAQTVMLRMKDDFATEKARLNQMSGVVKLVEVLRRWKRCRVFSGFRRWHSNSSLIGAAKQFREQVETILKKNTKDLHRDKVQALENQRSELSAKHAEYMQAKENEWENALNEAMQAADETRQRDLANAAEEHRAQLEQAEADFLFDLQAARKEAEEEVLRTIARKDAEIEQMHREFRVDADLAKQAAQQQLEDALIVKEQEMNEIMRQRLHLQEEDLGRKHGKLLEKYMVEHDYQMHQKENMWKQDMEKLKTNLNAQHAMAVHALNEEHRGAMAELDAQRQRELADLKEAMTAESERTQSQLRSDMHEASETRIRELRGVWQEEFDARCAQQRSELDHLLAVKMEEYGKAVEAEKQRAVKLEAAKWKQAMKDSSQSHELESMKTKAEVANEKDKEMRLELQKMTENFESRRRDDLAAHRADLEGARRDHAVALERQANANAAATEKLKLELEISLKQKHDALWTEKMNAELAAQDAHYKKKLAKEQERMDQLKQDFALQSQNFALERGNLQRQINQSDERILQIEAMNKADVAALKRGHEDALRQWEEKRQVELDKLDAQYARKIVDTRKETEVRCAVEAEKQLQEESQRMNEEMDRQVSQMQDESEKLISGLEQAMSNLKTEKGALTTELEGLSSKLEETEDSLYDLQQECKRVKMDSSLAVWKSVTKIFQMRQRFQDGIAQFDAEAAQRYEDIRRDMQMQIDHVTLTAVKLAALLQETDAARIGTHSILTSHRTAELISNRNKIAVMEQDLERLTMEKDSLEEQKELFEGDIRQMEGQVRELEDLIRSHNQESSMSNGRINVAHARKKRRLDTELEQLLESIEQKRHTMSQMDRRVTEKGHERDDLEMELIDIERKLVEILLEQQKLVLSRLDDGRLVLDKTKVVLGVGKITYPVPAEPTLQFVQQMLSKRQNNAMVEDADEHEAAPVVEKNKKVKR